MLDDLIVFNTLDDIVVLNALDGFPLVFVLDNLSPKIFLYLVISFLKNDK